MKKRLYCFLACLLLLFSGARAQTDSINAYLVTCEPGKAIYELYGHTAIWVENLSKGTDIVFNYGLFDFSTPHLHGGSHLDRPITSWEDSGWNHF